jgi:hypothetical protein
MKYPPKFKKLLIKACQELRDEFYCQEFELKVVFEDEVEGNEDVAAHIRTDFRYLNLTVYIRPPILRMYEAKDYRAIGECLIHEFCHILTDPIYKIAVDAITNSSHQFLEEVRERQTQRITNLIFPHIPKSIYTPTLFGLKAKNNH